MAVHVQLCMSYLYSLYDALISINVPSDRARAVVDAMERDMLTHLASKSDIDSLRLAGKSDAENLRAASKAEFENLRAASKAEVESLRAASKADSESLRAASKADIGSLRAAGMADVENLRVTLKADMEHLRVAVKADIDAMGTRLDALRREFRLEQEVLRSSMTIRLGSMFVVGLSLLFAALKLT